MATRQPTGPAAGRLGLRHAAAREAAAQVLAARARLAQVRAGPKKDDVTAQAAMVAKFRAAVSHAEAAFQRTARLRGGGAASAEEYDQRRTDVDSNRELLRQAEATLAALKTVRPEDVALAEAELAKAEAGHERAEAELEVTNVRSPIARVVEVRVRLDSEASSRVAGLSFARVEVRIDTGGR